MVNWHEGLETQCSGVCWAGLLWQDRASPHLGRIGLEWLVSNSCGLQNCEQLWYTVTDRRHTSTRFDGRHASSVLASTQRNDCPLSSRAAQAFIYKQMEERCFLSKGHVSECWLLQEIMPLADLYLLSQYPAHQPRSILSSLAVFAK